MANAFGSQTVPDTIVFSPETRDVVQQLLNLQPLSFDIPEVLQESSIKKADLIAWLNLNDASNDREQFLLETLRALLLNDLNLHFKLNKEEDEPVDVDWYGQLRYFFLAVAGVVYFGCEGFDGITALLSLLPVNPALIFFCGVFFSFISIAVFYFFDLAEISKNLGVNLRNTPRLIDVYLQQVDQIKSLRKSIAQRLFQCQSTTELKEDIAFLEMLEKRFTSLNGARDTLNKTLKNPLLRIAKASTALITSTIFFSAGFFTGQTLGVSLFGLLGITVSWPVVLISVVVALAALIVYWQIERPRFENLIGKWIGLDQEKIELFCDNRVVSEQEQKLSSLRQELERRCQDLQAIDLLNEQLDAYKQNKPAHRRVVSLDSSLKGPQAFFNSSNSFSPSRDDEPVPSDDELPLVDSAPHSSRFFPLNVSLPYTEAPVVTTAPFIS